MAERGKALGMGLTSLSAVLFGLMPVGASWIYAWGGDPVTLTFYRNLMVVPVLLAAMKAEGISFRTTRREAALLLLVGIGFRASTTLMLYQSYLYIPTGVATTLHFLYPLLTALVCRLGFRERLGPWKAAALALAAAGLWLSLDLEGGGAPLGFLLAVATACTYAGYVVSMDRTALREMHPHKVACYMGLGNAAAMVCVGVPTGQLRPIQPAPVLLLTFLLAVGTAFFAVTLFQRGIRLLGASSAALFSMLEPITSVAAGWLLLGEEPGLRSLLGCGLILGGVALAALGDAPPPAERDLTERREQTGLR